MKVVKNNSNSKSDKSYELMTALSSTINIYSNALKSFNTQYPLNDTLNTATRKQILKDAIVLSSIQDIKQTILSKKWNISYNKEQEELNEKEIELLEYTNYVFSDGWGLDTSFRNCLKAVLSAYECDISISEIIPIPADKGKYKNKLVFQKRTITETDENGNETSYIIGGWKTRKRAVLNNEISIGYDNQGNVVNIKQCAKEIPLDNIHFFSLRGDNESIIPISTLFETLYPHWWKKETTEILWAAYNELASKISAFIRINNNDEIWDDNGQLTSRGTALIGILNAFTEGGKGFAPAELIEQVDIQKVVDGGASKLFSEYIEKQEQKMALILEKPLALSIQGKHGSYSSDEVKAKNYYISLEDYKFELEEFVNKIIKKLIDYSYGEQEIYPHFEFETFFEDEVKTKLEVVKTAIEKNIISVENENNKIRQYLGLWAEKVIDEDIQKEEATDDDEQNINTNLKNTSHKNPPKRFSRKRGETTKNFSSEHTPKNTINFKNSPLKLNELSKPRTLNLKQVNEINDFEIKFYKNAEKNINDILQKMIQRSVNIQEIERILKTKNIDKVKEFKIKYTATLNKEYNKLLLDYYRDYYKFEKENFLKQKKELNLRAFVITPKTLENIKKIIQGQSYQFVNEAELLMTRIITTDMIAGITWDKTAQSVAFSILNKIEKRGLDDVNDYLVNNYLRTHGTTARNLATEQIAEETGLVAGYEYSAVLDPRVTDQCEILNNVLIRADDPNLESIRPSLHYNCRSLINPVYDAEWFNNEYGDNEEFYQNKIQRALAIIPEEFKK